MLLIKIRVIFVTFRFNPKTGLLGMSYANFKVKDLNFLGRLSLNMFHLFGLLHVEQQNGENKEYMQINNLTIINLLLKYIGPTREPVLTTYLLILQVRPILYI